MNWPGYLDKVMLDDLRAIKPTWAECVRRHGQRSVFWMYMVREALARGELEG